MLPFEIRIKNALKQVKSVTSLILISCLIFYVFISLSIVTPG